MTSSPDSSGGFGPECNKKTVHQDCFYLLLNRKILHMFCKVLYIHYNIVINRKGFITMTTIAFICTVIFVIAAFVASYYFNNLLFLFGSILFIGFITILTEFGCKLFFKSKRWINIKNKYTNQINECIEDANKIIEVQNKFYFYREYSCSAEVVKAASKNPYKYICKYFDLDVEEKYIDLLHLMATGFQLIDLNITNAEAKKIKLLKTIKREVPNFISKTQLQSQIGFVTLTKKYPQYVFVSEKKKYVISFDSYTCQQFLVNLKEDYHKKLFIKEQRRLMTDNLREAIKERDNYTCQICGVSTYQNPQIVLHIDHIIPVSKGGRTESCNLQTLCASCNLKKSNKIVSC